MTCPALKMYCDIVSSALFLIVAAATPLRLNLLLEIVKCPDSARSITTFIVRTIFFSISAPPDIPRGVRNICILSEHIDAATSNALFLECGSRRLRSAPDSANS